MRECERLGQRLTGIAVHTGARVAANAQAGEILVSSTVKDLVAGSGLEFRARGPHELRGVPERWELFEEARPHEEGEREPHVAGTDTEWHDPNVDPIYDDEDYSQ